MAPRYQVSIKDHSGVQIALVTNWQRLEYTKRVNAPASHVLALPGQSPVVAMLLAAASITDYQVEVYRRDLASTPVIPWTLDYEGFHRTDVQQTSQNGRSTFTSYGTGYDDLLDRRSILYPAGSAGSEKSGPGETVIKAFVNENAGPGATAPPRLFDGVTAGLTVQPDGGAGSQWDGARSYDSLLQVCQEIGRPTLVDFGTVGTGPGTFEFRAKAFPWGDDRSVAGLDPATGLNAAGNAPMVFSLAFGNMAAATYSRNRSQEGNAAIILGQGLEAARVVQELTDPIAVADSPWNRREVTRNANQETTTAGLDAVGATLIHDLRAQKTFSFEVIQTPATGYGRSYFLGDIVTARYGSFEHDYQITAVTVVVENGRETVSLTVQKDDVD